MDLGVAEAGRPHPARPGVAASLVGLLIAFFSMAGCQCDTRPAVITAMLLLWPLVFLAVAITRRPGLAAAYLLVIGVTWRLGVLLGFFGVNPAGVASDVLDVIHEALGVVLAGGNPYAHTFSSSQPPGIQAFAYPPGSLLYYLPAYLAGRIRIAEIVSAGIVLAGLWWAVRLTRSDLPVALMGLYAAAAPLAVLSTDNSNDTSAGALIFMAGFALLLARRRSTAGALAAAGVFMGWAAAFKLYALVYWPIFLAFVAGGGRCGLPEAIFRGRRVPAWWVYVAASLEFAGFLSLPFFVWSPAGFVRGMVIGPVNPHHGIGGWNIWAYLDSLGWKLWMAAGSSLYAVNFGLTLAVIGAAIWSRVRQPSQALLCGVVAWFVLMFTAKWTTYAYFAGVAPVAMLIPLADRLAAPPDREGIQRDA